MIPVLLRPRGTTLLYIGDSYNQFGFGGTRQGVGGAIPRERVRELS